MLQFTGNESNAKIRGAAALVSREWSFALVFVPVQSPLYRTQDEIVDRRWQQQQQQQQQHRNTENTCAEGGNKGEEGRDLE